MAFNVQTFRTRSLTAVIFAAVMITGLLANQWSFFILFSVIHFGCWVEYQKLVGLTDPEYKNITPFHRYGVMIAGWCLMLFFSSDSFQLFGIRLNELGWWTGLVFLFIMPVTETLFTRELRLKNVAYSAFGFLYISLCWGLMMNLYEHRDVHVHDTFYVLQAWFFPLIIIASIWINDTMAYISGSLIGKTPLSLVSPKKTWEGTIGGVVLSAGTIGLLSYYAFHLGALTIYLVVIAFIASVVGTVGDLLESKLKRLANVKDSGSLMPGHGGFLDRFDSLLLAIPMVWVFVYFLLR
jgi:phosphatidate cytidylyltransferase